MIHASADGDVTLVELRRPERRNALDLALCDAIAHEVRVAVDAGTRAVVVTGAGTSFCAGADLDGVYGDEFRTALYGMLRTVRDAPVPVVAAVNGPAIGAGTQLALACDLRVAAPTARFGVPTVRNGLAVDTWTIRALVDVAGGGLARRLMVAGELVDADEAVARGLADRAGTLRDAMAWAHELAALAPLTVAYSKRVLAAVADGWPPDEAEQARIDAAWDACWASDDVREAQRARAEKRPPVFRGR